jgi:hypothetical protein
MESAIGRTRYWFWHRFILADSITINRAVRVFFLLDLLTSVLQLAGTDRSGIVTIPLSPRLYLGRRSFVWTHIAITGRSNKIRFGFPLSYISQLLIMPVIEPEAISPTFTAL